MQLGENTIAVVETINATPLVEAAPIRTASRPQVRALLANLVNGRGYTVEQFVGKSGSERIRIGELDPRS